MAQPHYGVWPRGWLFIETADYLGVQKQDRFCIGRRFHITVSQGVPSIPDGGWHVSVKPTCDCLPGGDPVGASVYLPEVKRFFEEAKAWSYLGPLPSEVGSGAIHFHENLELRAKRN